MGAIGSATRRVVLIVLFVLCGLSLEQVTAATTHSTIATYVKFEGSAPVVNVLYKYGHNDAAPSGAYGANVSAPRSAWFIEEQRAGGTDVVAGVIRHDGGLIAEGLKMFHWGLARQAPNGSFPGSAWPFHGVAFFLSEAAPALIFLDASPYAEQFGSELRWQVPRMRRAAFAMVRAVHGAGKIDDSIKNHRYFEAAIALGATGILSNNGTLRKWSTIYAVHGIGMARPTGVMPEDGGHDSGYQALGLINATRYMQLVATGALYSRLYATVQRGEDWEISRVRTDGSINQSGDTRTAGCAEHNTAGQCKTVFYAPIFSALARWAAISRDARFERASRSVWSRSGYGGT